MYELMNNSKIHCEFSPLIFIVPQHRRSAFHYCQNWKNCHCAILLLLTLLNFKRVFFYLHFYDSFAHNFPCLSFLSSEFNFSSLEIYLLFFWFMSSNGLSTDIKIFPIALSEHILFLFT